jgi:hypothetical protein
MKKPHHKKTFFPIVLACFFLTLSFNVQSQIKELISTSGNQTSNEYTLSESLGQAFIHQISHNEFSLSEGFQQHHKIKVFKNSHDTSFKIYPNPVREFLNIKSKEKLQQIGIFNEQGALIKSIENINLSTYELNLSELHPGLYFIKLVGSNQKISIQKIIKI